MPLKSALITGITGQDGAYLAQLLLHKGYTVHGLHRRTSVDNTERLTQILDHPSIHLHDGDLLDAGNLYRLIAEIGPDEIYNLGAQSHVGTSFKTPDYTAQVDGIGVLRMLEAMRLVAPEARFYQASSSELFGNAPAPQSECTPFQPQSPYACAKLYGYWITVNYRDAYGLHASNGILFNHESPWRAEDFVTRKVTKAVAEIEIGAMDVLSLGNLEARRDWGHARDYVEGMWRMLQQDEAGDYVLATGQTHSVRELVELAFAEVDMPLVWRGFGPDEAGYHARTNRKLVQIDPAFYRPNEVHHLCGDARKARDVLDWTPMTSFKSMIAEMVAADRARLEPYGRGEDALGLFKYAA